MKNKTWTAMLAGAAALVGRRKKSKPKAPPAGQGSAMSHLRELTANTIQRRQRTANRKGGWLIPQQASYYHQRSPNGAPIPVYRSHYRPTSKYSPHQGAAECARRRRQIGLGEFRPGGWRRE